MYSGEGVYGKGQSLQEKVCCGWELRTWSEGRVEAGDEARATVVVATALGHTCECWREEEVRGGSI